MSESVTGDPAAEQLETGEGESERNEWLELFFDLVVVAAVAVLSEGLREDPSALGVALFALLYGGIWRGWVTIVLYANVARQQTRTRTVMVAMALVAIMAATVPSHFSSRANAFAIAFLGLRILATRASFGTGRLLKNASLLQLGGATTPWIVAMWVDTPGKYALWGLGLVLDIGGLVLTPGGVDEKDLARVNERMTKQHQDAERKAQQRVERNESRAQATLAKHPEYAERMEAARPEWGTPAPVTSPAAMEVVDVEAEHLSERLGLFVIIVLGEAVSALVLTAARTDWSRPFVGVAVAGFALLVGLWWLTFSYGFSGAPHAELGELPPRVGLPMHLLTTIGIVALAAGIGEMAAEPDHALHGVLRWVMCVGLTLTYIVMGVSGRLGGAPWRWVLGWALPCAVLPLVVAALPDALTNQRAVWCLVATIGWMALYGRFAQTRPARGRPRGLGRPGRAIVRSPESPASPASPESPTPSAPSAGSS